MNDPKVTISLPADLGARLGEAAKERAVGRNLLASLIIEHWLNNAPDPGLMLYAVQPNPVTHLLTVVEDGGP